MCAEPGLILSVTDGAISKRDFDFAMARQTCSQTGLESLDKTMALLASAKRYVLLPSQGQYSKILKKFKTAALSWSLPRTFQKT